MHPARISCLTVQVEAPSPAAPRNRDVQRESSPSESERQMSRATDNIVIPAQLRRGGRGIHGGQDGRQNCSLVPDADPRPHSASRVRSACRLAGFKSTGTVDAFSVAIKCAETIDGADAGRDVDARHDDAASGSPAGSARAAVAGEWSPDRASAADPVQAGACPRSGRFRADRAGAQSDAQAGDRPVRGRTSPLASGGALSQSDGRVRPGSDRLVLGIEADLRRLRGPRASRRRATTSGRSSSGSS